ncbi:hypothetical protein BGX23_003426 [Mortierella sp. AD031]|nr:hypothetical protein BGX23_003426 [Mortierella sp. AD031]
MWILDWASPSETGKQSWQRLYIPETDRNPFCYIEPVVEESERPSGARNDNGADAKTDMDCTDVPQKTRPMENEKLFPSAMASGIVNLVTSNIVSTSTSTAAAKPLAAANLQQDRRVEQPEKRALNATKAEPGISADSIKKPELARLLDIVRPATTNAALEHTAWNADLSREASKDAGHTIPPPDQPLKQEPGPTMPTNNNDRLVAQPDTLDPKRNKAADAAPALPAPVDMHIGVELNPSHKEAKDYRKKGYCENYRGFIDSYDKHVESAAHQKYANKVAKFAQLDGLLAKLQRRPRVDFVLPSYQCPPPQSQSLNRAPALPLHRLAATSPRHWHLNLLTRNAVKK